MYSVISQTRIPSLSEWQNACRDVAYERFWTVFLVSIGSISNLVYTCTLPFVCLGVITGMTLPRRKAIGAAFLIWLANQFCGYTIHNYPRTFESYTWGIVLLIGTLLVTYLANQIPLFTKVSYLRLAGCLVGGFILFQIVIWLAGLFLTAHPTPFMIILRIFAVNSVWTLGLTVAHSALVWDRVQQFSKEKYEISSHT